MRTTLLAALTITTLALAGCAGEEPQPVAPPPPPPPPVVVAPPPAPEPAPAPPPKPMLSELIPRAIQSMTEAFNAHEAQRMAALFTEDATVAAYGAGESRGRADLAKGMAGFFATFSDAKSAATREWIKGNVAIVEMVWAGTMTADMMGVKASKKPVGTTRVNVLFFNDEGLIKEMHEYGDDAGLMAQMQVKKGAPPVPAVPSGAPVVHVAKGTAEEDKLAEWARTSDEAFNKGDAKAAAGTLADDADYWMNMGGQPAMKGKSDNLKGLTAWFKSFPDQKWALGNAWGIDGFVIYEHTMAGTNKGAMAGMPATNKKVAGWHFIDIVQPTADGKVQHGWGYANPIEMMIQTGLVKMPGAGAPPAAPAPAATPKKK